MAHFRDPTHHERNLKFEMWQQLTDAVLRRPGVQQQLGALGARLIAVNETAFLPNVDHRVVSVPRRYLGTDCIGILPYLDSDSDLTPHNTLLQPTPARKEHIREALGRAGLDNAKRGLNEYVQRAVAQITEEERTGLVNPRRSVSGGAANHYDANTGILVTSRPLVVARWQDLPRNRILRGAVGAHELVHTLDVEELTEQPDMLYRARTELRGRRVGAIVAEDGIASGDLMRWRFEQDDNGTVEVEEIRHTYDIDSDELLNGGFQFDDYNFAPLTMGILGYIEL